MKQLARRAHALSDVAGDDHDLAVLRAAARERHATLAPGELALLERLVARRRAAPAAQGAGAGAAPLRAQARHDRQARRLAPGGPSLPSEDGHDPATQARHERTGGLGRRAGVHGHVGHVRPAEREESIATIHAALDTGIDLLDTGDFYGMGHNEMLIGEAIRGRPREDYRLSVKFGAQRGPDSAWLGYDASPRRSRPRWPTR